MSVRRHSDDEIDRITWRRLSDSLEATRGMLTQAQITARASQAELVRLANEFCYAEMRPYHERNTDLSRIPAEELGRLLHRQLKQLTLKAAANTSTRLEEADQEIARLRGELEAQRERAAQAEGRVTSLESQVRTLENTLAREKPAHRESANSNPSAVHQSESNAAQTELFEQWLATWKSHCRNWERITGLVRLVGESGLSQAAELAAVFAHANGLGKTTVYRLLRECTEAGLLVQNSGETLEGRPPTFYTLTIKGRWLHHRITGTPPNTPMRDMLLKVHKSERHLAVILKTAEHFTRLGFFVDRQPQRLEVTANCYFQPDLLVRKNGESFYIEVEVGEKDKPSLEAKWANALAAGGCICVATDNLHTLRRIQGGIAQWSGYEGRSVRLYITCLPELKEKQPGDSPWYAVKNYSPG